MSQAVGVRTDGGVDAVRPLPIPGLTGLRIVGAVWVMLFHFQPTLYQVWPALRHLAPILGVGDLGVPLFFLLSGFIIWHNYGFRSLLAPRSTVRFIWRRFARLWPVNVLSQILTIPIIVWAVYRQGAAAPDWFNVPGFLGSAFMVTELAHPDLIYPWNQPSWSLAGEMAEYLFFPLLTAVLLLVIGKGRNRWAWTVAALILAIGIRQFPFVFPYRWMLDLTTYFVIGVMLRVGGIPRPRLAPVAAVAQIAAPLGVLAAAFTNQVPFIVLCLAIWVWALSAPGGPGVWLFSRRPFEIAGLSSYSVYMLHWVVFGYATILVPKILSYVTILAPWLRASFLGIYAVLQLVVVGAIAYVTWRFFETPARRLLNRAFERIWPRRQDQRVATSPQDVAAGPGHAGEAIEIFVEPNSAS